MVVIQTAVWQSRCSQNSLIHDYMHFKLKMKRCYFRGSQPPTQWNEGRILYLVTKKERKTARNGTEFIGYYILTEEYNLRIRSIHTKIWVITIDSRPFHILKLAGKYTLTRRLFSQYHKATDDKFTRKLNQQTTQTIIITETQVTNIHLFEWLSEPNTALTQGQSQKYTEKYDNKAFHYFFRGPGLAVQ